MEKKPPELMTSREVAEAFRVNVNTVTKWATSGRLPIATKTLGGQRRFRRTEIEALLRGAR